jgi:hypothetical protein
MAENVVKLGNDDPLSPARERLSDADFTDFSKLKAHPAVIGHAVFDDKADVIVAENIDEGFIATFANAFDICGELTDEVGQKAHVGTVFESRKMEITCRRYGDLRAIVVQGKGGKAGKA